MNTLELAPSDNAKNLFNGGDLSNWTTRAGHSAGWKAENGILHVVPGSGDIMTKERCTDFYLHLEFRCPDMPGASGQAKGNSGVFLQGRYEIQVLDSHGLNIPGTGDCGAIYHQFAPLKNACKPALEWQSYDVFFRAPRAGENDGPRLSVLHNGQLIHNNIELPGVTGAALDEAIYAPGPLLLQDHSDLVCYRNIWIEELPLQGSDTYEPR
ncbi:MAG: 3-keto-disaccharide hydrolase [Candidatus Latescibacterota bacterium]|jgi:hypothetical protein|tara:strand:- start:231 stop:863 length:633 start_codon:yes stop_codon:yes gene_type:complete